MLNSFIWVSVERKHENIFNSIYFLAWALVFTSYSHVNHKLFSASFTNSSLHHSVYHWYYTCSMVISDVLVLPLSKWMTFCVRLVLPLRKEDHWLKGELIL